MIFTTKLFTNALPGFLFDCDTILWDGRYWIVPAWIEDQTTRKRRPERIILLDNLKHQTLPPGSAHHFFLNDSIPKDVFSGLPPEGTSYHVILFPEVFYDIPGHA